MESIPRKAEPIITLAPTSDSSPVKQDKHTSNAPVPPKPDHQVLSMHQILSEFLGASTLTRSGDRCRGPPSQDDLQRIILPSVTNAAKGTLLAPVHVAGQSGTSPRLASLHWAERPVYLTPLTMCSDFTFTRKPRPSNTPHDTTHPIAQHVIMAGQTRSPKSHLRPFVGEWTPSSRSNITPTGLPWKHVRAGECQVLAGLQHRSAHHVHSSPTNGTFRNYPSTAIPLNSATRTPVLSYSVTSVAPLLSSRQPQTSSDLLGSIVPTRTPEAEPRRRGGTSSAHSFSTELASPSCVVCGSGAGQIGLGVLQPVAPPAPRAPARPRHTVPSPGHIA